MVDLFQPATTLLASLARRDLSSRELVAATLARIHEFGPALNAVVTVDAEAALAAADASDRRRAEGTPRLLEGLPVTIKDAFDVAGMRSTAGSTAYAHRVPERDAAAVARLRQAGAVIIGKTNVPPLSDDWVTENTVFGRTLSPWDPTRSPGGSSGGAVAALATGMAALELGSDLGGSIRWPAHACGVFGLKPTWGLVSTRGHVPPPPGVRAEADLAVAGPLARSAADLDLALAVIMGPPDLAGVGPRLDAAGRREPRGLRVALWADDPAAPVDSSVRDAVIHAAALLAGAGAQVDDDARPGFSFSGMFEVYALLFHAMHAAGLPEEERRVLAASASRFPADDRSHAALRARAARLDVTRWQDLQQRRQAIKRAWDAFFQRYDVILMPPAPVGPVLHPEVAAFERSLIVNGRPRPWFDLLHWAAPASLAHLPAVVAPVLRAADGLPRGVQVVAAEGADCTAIAVAGMLEALCGGFVAPPGPWRDGNSSGITAPD